MSVPDAEPLPVLEALHSTPARRYLSPEPVPDEVIWAILDAAVRGPSGGNQQGWGWVVVTDPATKAQIAAWYLEGWDAAYGRRREEILAAPPGWPGPMSKPREPGYLPGGPRRTVDLHLGAGGAIVHCGDDCRLGGASRSRPRLLGGARGKQPG